MHAMHKFKRVIAILPILLLPVAALAANEVTVDADTTLVLGGDSSTYTLKNNSQVDSMTADTTSFSFTLSQGGRVTLISGSRRKLATNASAPAIATFTCGTDQSRLDLSLDSPYTTTAVTVTPGDTCSTGSNSGGGNSGSGGGGGGGSNSPSPVPAPAQTIDKVALLKKQIQETQAKIAQKIGQSQGQGAFGATPPAFGVFAKNIAPGQKDDEVKRLQQLLATDKDIYPNGVANGIFGPATMRAVKAFQKKYGLAQVGSVGPLTRKKLQEVFGKGTPVPPSAPSVIPSPNPASPSPAQSSAIQDQIKALQAQLLQQQIKLIQDKINSLKK